MSGSKWMLLAALSATFAAGAVRADERKPPPSQVNWASRPSTEDREAALGPVVKTEALYRAVIRCAVADDGALGDCRVEAETPNGSGIGAAALTLVPKYRRKPPGSGGAREVRFAEGSQSVDKEADWLRRPTPEDLLAVFPTEAYKHGVSGRAVINCIVTVQGALRDCVTMEETPNGAGFGGAAIALTPQFLMRPATKNGAPAPSVVSVPINFKMSGPGESFGVRRVIDAAIAWTEAPTYDEVAAAYPPKARAEKRGGRATVACDMTEQGRLTHCRTATSDPRGYGFEKAAEALAKRFVIAVNSDADRKATRGIEVHVPFVFDPAMLESNARVVGKPTWAALPKAEQLNEAFKDVTATGAARVVIQCAVKSGGFVGDCKVLSETPPGLGIGAAALALSPTFRLSTWTAEGLPTIGGLISIPIRYDVTQKDPAKPPATP